MRIFISTLVVALSAAFLVHFILIWVYGAIVISEPNKIILVLEIALLTAILAYGVYGFIREAKKEVSK